MSKFSDIITQLLFDAPPREINSVYDSLVIITEDTDNDTLLDALKRCLVAKRLPIDVEGSPTIVTEYNKDGAKYFDPFKKVLFSVDCLDRVGLDIEPHESETTPYQEKLYEELQKYVAKNFPGDSACTVLPTGDDDELAIIIVSSKFSPSNYWSGYWKSEYIYSPEERSLTGRIDVVVHYFEDGNVKFSTQEFIDKEDINDPISCIRALESEIETGLDESFSKLNQTQFAKLRRKLPVTRSKVNWGKAISNYRLGKDAAQGK
ncbi:ABR007Cp [Eremothecium gossypii ATCC 10895]|uniref:F-actin-capping protein subunit alpha n=1 Tax=Eremothecium gossypii (strain ATCC 10895 / CBS 109.51 / FGSC 9923 / NRRL Y-1056) TaxID=284811 RepID=CAPZA_EREGS|nr:ABR007Cp [Eremothecium gossypii ATCC 10895]Q75DS4.1 RecName: Full=F-actin-capping protein subunit alpha [Eremothecium gossypii ATCC 10895]AAS50777.1 ABR007Cp [Eremothecium gossypii ATCC 10895]AEY95066.1 FABR007Cp [Eremothecium gossypii FDAG1]